MFPFNINNLRDCKRNFKWPSMCFFFCFDKWIILKTSPLNSHRQEKKQKNSLNKQKPWYIIHTWSNKAIKATVVNQTLPSLHGGSP